MSNVVNRIYRGIPGYSPYRCGKCKLLRWCKFIVQWRRCGGCGSIMRIEAAK